MSNTAMEKNMLKTSGRYRWVICALLFFATTVNYVDRQVLGILAPDLQKQFGWNEIGYGNIVMAFQAAYAIGLLVMGRILDIIGTRLGYLIALIFWSVAAMAHALAGGAFGFGVARFFLGLGEAGNFPAAVKTVAEWFPRKERALAIGIFNAGSNVGAIVAPLTVPFIAITFGWQWAFILTGGIGLVWIIFWLALYRKPAVHPKLSADELKYIQQDPPDTDVKVPWLRLLSFRGLWSFSLGKFMT
ncbi:MAG: MFS transporter, partial [Fibrobacteres bacterium]|nr:MFS transporter [Fibrobacterota bacterium]